MKKSYKGFPVYELIILAVLIAWQMFVSMLDTGRGTKIEYSKMLEYIEKGMISDVALEDDTIYARLATSSISRTEFSSKAYDLVALGDRDTFV